MDFFTLDIRKKVFTVRVVRHCNTLPIALLDTPTRPHSSGRSQQRAREAREGPEPQRRGGEGRGAQRSGVGLGGGEPGWVKRCGVAGRRDGGKRWKKERNILAKEGRQASPLPRKKRKDPGGLLRFAVLVAL